MITADETVRFRKHRDGSMTILSKDGMQVIDHIRASEFRSGRPESTMNEPSREARGLALGFVLGLASWGVVLAGWWIVTR
jgi:hypothetical protein